MTSLLNKLRSGWNPWLDNETKRTYALFEDVSAKYEKTLEKTLRKNTRDSYLSRINVLRAYLKQQPTPIKYAYQFNTALVVDFFVFHKNIPIHESKIILAHSKNIPATELSPGNSW